MAQLFCSRRKMLVVMLVMGMVLWGLGFQSILTGPDTPPAVDIKSKLEDDSPEVEPTVKKVVAVGGGDTRNGRTPLTHSSNHHLKPPPTIITQIEVATERATSHSVHSEGPSSSPSPTLPPIPTRKESSALGLEPLPTLPPSPPAEAYSSVIPRVRHTIWKSKELPSQAEAIDRNWREREPSFSHVLHDDAECLMLAKRYAAERTTETPEVRYLPASQLRLLSFNYTYNFLQVYENYQLNVMRADVCRVLVIYYYGGFYMDLDVDFARPIKDWKPVRWEGTDLLLGMEYGSPQRDINNFFFAATARHPCLRILLEHLNRHGQDPNPFMLRDRNTIHKHTGPTVWLYAFKECRVPREYLHTPRTVYQEGGRTSLLEIGARFYESPHVRQNNYHNAKEPIGWYEPLPQINREDLHGILVDHKYGSNRWRDAKYGSWTAKEASQKSKLRSGEAVEALGERARVSKDQYMIRPQDPDEVHLSLIRKHRFVVWQNSAPMTGDALSTYNTWVVSEPHMTHQIVGSDECLSLARLMTGRATDVVSDTLCGLLAVHLMGGGFYMHHSVKRTGSFFDWPEGSWTATDVLLVGDAPNVHTTLFGASAEHRCTKHAIERLTTGNVESVVSPGKFWDAWRDCSIDDKYFKEDRRYVVYGINKYAMGVRLEWLQSKGFPRSYNNKQGGQYQLQPRSKLLSSIVTLD